MTQRGLHPCTHFAYLEHTLRKSTTTAIWWPNYFCTLTWFSVNWPINGQNINVLKTKFALKLGKICGIKTIDCSGIRTLIIGVEGDNLAATTTARTRKFVITLIFCPQDGHRKTSYKTSGPRLVRSDVFCLYQCDQMTRLFV